MSPLDPVEIRLELLPIEQVSYHLLQARKHVDREDLLHLMLAIDRVGLLHPILVRRREDRYELISGFRRLNACQKLGWTHIPAIIRDMSDEEALQAAVFANTASLDLQLMERCEAISYVAKVMDREPPQEIAQWFGVSEDFLGIARKLVSLPTILREALLGGVLNPAQAIELSRIEDPKLLTQAASRVAREQMPPTETSVFVDEVLRTRAVPGIEEGEEGDDSIAPARRVERLYSKLAGEGTLEADALRAALRAVLASAERPSEEFLDLSYPPEESFYLYHHAANVAKVAVLIGRVRGFDASETAMLAVCALLHDVGMMRVPRDVLAKVEPLSAEERAGIQAHVEVGARILERSGLREEVVLAAIRQHHERGDGSGYPRGVREAQIHPYARILAVADVYEALVSPRPHRLPDKPSQAVREILDLASHGLLDPATVQQFIRGVGHYPPGSRVRLSTGEVGVVTRVNPTHPDRPVIRLFSPDGEETMGVRTELDLLASPRVQIVG